MLNSKSPLHLLSKVWAIGVLLLFSCQSFADTTSGGATPPPPPPPPSVTVTTGDPGDPNPVETDSCLVSAGVKNAPLSQDESATIQHWSWSVGTVTVTPYDGSADITADASDFSISLNPIVDPGKPDDGKIDDSNPAATFTGTFRLTGYYAIPVTATVHFVDSVTGADDGKASYTDYVGDSQDNPAYDPTVDYADGSTSSPAMTPNASGERPYAPLAPAPVPPAKPALPSKRLVSGILSTLPNPAKLGLNSKNHSTATFTITIKPRLKVGDVAITVPSGVAAANVTAETVKNTKGQDVQTGNLVLVLTATDYSRKLPGDAMLATQVSTKKVISSATVLVLVAANISPHPKPFAQNMIGKNYAVNEDTKTADGPPTPNIPRAYKALISAYTTSETLQVVDQFGSPLNGIFAGTSVVETISYEDVTTKQQVTKDLEVGVLSGSGSYVDTYVGAVTAHSVVTADDTEATKWLNEPADTPSNSTTIGIAPPVKIGGNTLTPGLQGRTATLSPPTPPNTLPELDIDWP